MRKISRKLGKSAIEVSPLGFGCWAIGGPFTMFGKADGWGNMDDDESIRAIHRAIELGVSFFDTADAYGTGHSEEVLGKAVNGMRDKVVIATKGGFVYREETKELIGEDTSPAYIRKALDASLRRLGTDYVDLYQVHNYSIPVENMAPLFFELDKLVTEGKIRTYGWSTGDAEHAKMYAAGTNGSVIQHASNLFSYDQKILDLCEQYDLGSINNMPLGMGFLSGKFNESSRLSADDVRGAGHSWVQYFEDGKPKKEFLDKLNAVREILTSNGRTAVQGALAWLWAKSPLNIPIPGFKNVKQAEDNAGAMAFGPLTPSQMAEIDLLLG